MQVLDGTSRHHARGQDLSLMCMLGTFAHHTVVNEASCHKFDRDALDRAACRLTARARHEVVAGVGALATAGGIGIGRAGGSLQGPRRQGERLVTSTRSR